MKDTTPAAAAGGRVEAKHAADAAEQAGASPPVAAPRALPDVMRRPGGIVQLLIRMGRDARDSLLSALARLRGVRRTRIPWGVRRERTRDPAFIGIYDELLPAAPEARLDARTWEDLHLEAVFAEVDRCASTIGQQTLYCWLRRPSASNRVLEERSAAADRMAGAPEVRQRVQQALAPLDTLDACFLPNLFASELPPPPRFRAVFPLLSMLALAMAGVTFVRPTFGLAGLLLVSAINLSIQYRYHRRIQPVTRPLTMLRRLIAAADAISRLRDPVLEPVLERLRQHNARLQGLSRAARYVAVELRGNDLIGSIYAWLNMLLLLDVNAFAFSVEAVRHRRADLAAVFETLGFLDAVSAIGSWRSTPGLRWCQPLLSVRGRRLSFQQLVHPLLDNAVANDFTIEGRSILITGSNMSGKTTFLRAVAVNAVLAQTVATCTAAAWRSPCLRVRSMIGRGDDLARGQSYFAVELELAHGLLRAAAGEAQHLFVIDEIFRGTNTTERVAASRAVLERLAAGDHSVLAATHDLELLHLLDDRWEFHHFRESVEDSRLLFDYRIPAGTHIDAQRHSHDGAVRFSAGSRCRGEGHGRSAGCGPGRREAWLIAAHGVTRCAAPPVDRCV